MSIFSPNNPGDYAISFSIAGSSTKLVVAGGRVRIISEPHLFENRVNRLTIDGSGVSEILNKKRTSVRDQ